MKLAHRLALLTLAMLVGVPAGASPTDLATDMYGARMIPRTAAPQNCVVGSGHSCLWLDLADSTLYFRNAAGLDVPLFGGAGSGTVSLVATGNGLSGGPISTTGTLNLNLYASGGLSKVLGVGSAQLGIAAGGVTAAMLDTSYMTGSLTAPRIPFASGAHALTDSAGLTWDDTNKTQTVTHDALAAALTNGSLLTNTTAASGGTNVQRSPVVAWHGSIWTGSAAEDTDWNLGASGALGGTANDTPSMIWSSKLPGAGSFSERGGIFAKATGDTWIQVSDVAQPGYSLLGLYDNSGGGAVFQPSTYHGYVGTSTNHGFSIRTNNRTRLYIDNAGLVGIGTFTPTQALEVTGAVKISTQGTSTGLALTAGRLVSTTAGDLTGGGALTGDLTLGLATTAVSAASYGSASSVGTFTVDTKGRLTAAASTAIAIGDAAVTFASEAANKVHAGPTSGGSSAPTWRSLVAADLPSTAVTPGSYGDGTHVATFTVDAQGRLTLAGTTAITGGSGGIGTVTSVAMTVPSILSVSGSPVTSSGTLAVTLATETANLGFFGPSSGGAATPTFRSMVAADLPATAVSAGTYNLASLTVDAQGRLTSAANGLSSTANIFHVGKESWMYASVAAAVTAINAGVAPTSTNRYVILVWPGKYTSTTLTTIPSFVGLKGLQKGLVQFQNDTTDLFRASDDTWFEDFLVEGSATSTLYAFDLNNSSRVHVRRVDMLNNGGSARQKFLKQSGATWITLFIEDSVVDMRGLSGYSVKLTNTSGAARFTDTIINNVLYDAYGLTGFGGSFQIQGCQDVRIYNSTIRGAATWNTGVRVELNAVSGIPTVQIHHSYLSDAVPVYGESGTNYDLLNVNAVGALFDGTRTVQDSVVKALITPTTYVTGDLPYASATDTISRLADVATGQVLRSGGVGVAPAYGALVASDLPNTAVTPASYTLSSITVDAQGRITSAANGTAVTSVATSGGITGGTITTTGTLSLDLAYAASKTVADTWTVTGGGVAVTAGGTLSNTTAAALGAQQASPAHLYSGKGWDSTASSSKASSWALYGLPVQTAGNPTGQFVLSYSTNGGGYSTAAVFGSGGTLGPSATQLHTLPAVNSDTFALLAASQTFTNKTLTSPVITTPTSSGSGAWDLSGTSGAFRMPGGTAPSVAAGVATGSYGFDFRTTVDGTFFHLASNSVGDNGFYVVARSGPQAIICGGCTSDGSGNFVSKNATAGAFGTNSSGNFSVRVNGGTTPGNTYTQTERLQIDTVSVILSNHLVVGGNPGATTTTIAAGTGAGTSPTVVTVTGTDNSGKIAITTGTTPATAADIATVTFGTAYGSAPICMVEAASSATFSLALGTTWFYAQASTTASLFKLQSGAVGLAGSTAYIWNYHCIG